MYQDAILGNPHAFSRMLGGGKIASPLNLHAFMGGQADGVFFDFTKTDRMFQENVGPTPADDVNESIGLALSQRAWGGKTLAELLAAAAELAPNASFDTWTDPTVPDGWTKTGTHNATNYVEQSPAGSLHLVSDGTYVAVAFTGLTIGRSYRVSVVVDEVLDASIAITLGTGTDVVIAAAGTYERIISATASFFEIKRQASTGTVNARISSVSIKEVPGKHAIQATSTLKPTRQTTGAKFDGSDDNLLTSYAAGAGENFIVALVDVPASIAATQGIAGTLVSSSSYGLLGISTAGTVRVGLGDVLINYGDDLRGQTAVVGMSYSGGTGRAFSGVDMSEFPYGSAPDSTTPYTIGALKTGTGVSNFFAGSIKKLVAGRRFLDLATYRKIRKALLTA